MISSFGARERPSEVRRVAHTVAIFASAALVLVATLYPRLALLGGFPSTDEGIYAFAAQLIHESVAAGKGLPDYGVLNLYPALLSWVFSLDWNHLVLLRALDMLVAVCVGWLLFLIAARESASVIAGAVLAAVFSFAMNQHAFVQQGFKNSFFAAYVPLLLAAHIGLDPKRWNDLRSYLCGGLVAVAVLFRETLAPFAVLGAIAIFLAHGWRHSVRYMASGVVAALMLMGVVLLSRGGIAGTLAAYLGAADFYQSIAPLRAQLFWSTVETTGREAGYAGLLGLGALAAILVSMLRGQVDWTRGRLAFWVAATATPLLEAATKIAYPYHISVCLLGLCGLTALGWRSVARLTMAGRASVVALAVTATLILAWPQFGKLNQHYRNRALPDLTAIAQRAWPPESIARSNYLLLADAIGRSMQGQSGTLSSSASMLALFPLTGLLPPAYGMEDLSNVAWAARMDAARLRSAISECPADVIMLSTRNEIPGRTAIAEALAGLPEYVEVTRVPIATGKDYGAFGGSVYRRSGARGACRRDP